jgi:transcriptional regulator
MYVPAAFRVADEAALVGFMADYPFATLVTAGADGLAASHVPALYDAGRRAIHFHLAAANPQAAAADGTPALAIFAGPHAYVSPSWYATGPSVPTWNYAAVHAAGRLARLTDPAATRPLLARLVAAFERRDSGWSMGAQPADFMAKMLAGIVGFSLSVERLEGKFKLSQNRPEEDRRRVVAALAASPRADDRALADFMRGAGVLP